ncbi:MAG TPA: hypothetical protein VH599_14485 [Ktedonobacterales bacterium]
MSSTTPFDGSLFDFTLRYQRTPGAQYHVRPLSLLQQEMLYRCDGRVTIADLSDATKYTHPEIRNILSFLSAHGLVQTIFVKQDASLKPEAWLFKPPAQQQIGNTPTQPLPQQQPPARIRAS